MSASEATAPEIVRPITEEPASISEEAFADFEQASKAVLKFLDQRIGMGAWVISRMRAPDYVVLQSVDHEYGIKPGETFRLSDTLCSRMVQGKGPRVACDAQKIDAYRDAGASKTLDIGSYIGIPLHEKDGSLFGSLCAISPEKKPIEIQKEQPLLEMMARLLSTILSHELEHEETTRKAEQAEQASMRDSLTELFNRRGFDMLMNAEEKRCARYGHPASIIAIDLNGLKRVNDQKGHAAGDEMIVKAAKALNSVARTSDIVARVGGDEFLILAVECGEDDGRDMVRRVKVALAENGVRAAIGVAAREPTHGLDHACRIADEQMYEDKRRSGQGRAAA